MPPRDLMHQLRELRRRAAELRGRKTWIAAAQGASRRLLSRRAGRAAIPRRAFLPVHGAHVVISPEVEKFAVKLTMYVFLVAAWSVALYLLFRGEFHLAALAVVLGTLAAVFLYISRLQSFGLGELLESRTHQAGELVSTLRNMAVLLGTELMTANAASHGRNGKTLQERQRSIDQIEGVLRKLGIDEKAYSDAKKIYIDKVAADLLEVMRFLQNRILQSCLDKLNAEREMRFKGAINPHDPAYQDFVKRWKGINRLRDDLNANINSRKLATGSASAVLAKHSEVLSASKALDAESRDAMEKVVRGIRARIEKVYAEGRVSDEDAAFIERLNQIDQQEANWRGVYSNSDAA